MTARILVADPIASDGVELLRGRAQVDVKTGLKPDELVAIIGEYDGLVVRSETKVTAQVINAGDKLQVIGRAGVGVDNIDLDAASRRGIVVVNAPTGNTISAAEHSIALMLSLARYIPQADATLRQGQWKRSEFTGVEVRNKVLGVIGLGKVGSEVARRAKGLEMRVIGYDPFISFEHAQHLGVSLLSLEEVLREADFISVHVPLTPATRNLIGEKELKLVKPTVRIVNCARGRIIDEEALYHAVEEGRVAGAAFDVFAEEPTTDSILFKSKKIIVTPHLGASTAEAQVNVALDVAEQIVAVLEGQPAKYAVNTPFIAPETYNVVMPYLGVALQIGRLATQLAEGQMGAVTIKYEGDIANYDTALVKAGLIRGLLEPISEEQVNLVNATIIAASRGLKVIEQKDNTTHENYGNLMTVTIATSAGDVVVAGTHLRGEPHIVQVNGYWIDLVPTENYFLFSDHLDRPGLIGAVGTILGNADINISSMIVGRLKPRGRALMVLALDEPIPEEIQKVLLDIPDIYGIKLVRLSGRL